ncbi:hypothetical protein D6C95_02684 [Aureobasidium pullulans]|nr:hypothetical protein D6C95_02684 [Aureobasidium pullulans]
MMTFALGDVQILDDTAILGLASALFAELKRSPTPESLKLSFGEANKIWFAFCALPVGHKHEKALMARGKATNACSRPCCLRTSAVVKVVVKPERGTISGLLAAYEIGRLVNCSIEPKLLEDTPSTRMSAFCVEGFSYEDPAEAI